MSWATPEHPYAKTPGTSTPPKPLCVERPTPSPDFQKHVDEYITGRGLQPSVAQANYWYPSINANDGELRVVIPCTSSLLTNRYWQARVLDDSHITPQVPRYTSPRKVRRGDALAIVWPTRAKSKIKGTALVEGPFDALAAASVGLLGIAWMGTKPGPDPVAFAHRMVLEHQPVFVVQDRGATQEAITIWQQFPGAFLVDPYPRKDLAETPEDERKDLFWL